MAAPCRSAMLLGALAGADPGIRHKSSGRKLRLTTRNSRSGRVARGAMGRAQSYDFSESVAGILRAALDAMKHKAPCWFIRRNRIAWKIRRLRNGRHAL